MSLKFWPEAFASKCAVSNSPQPRPVDVLSDCNVSTGTPVSFEILVTTAPFETTEPKTRKNAAVIKLNVLIVIKLQPFETVSILARPMVAPWPGVRSRPSASEASAKPEATPKNHYKLNRAFSAP